jgi:alpha-1,6-mannosyltransferase
MRSRQFFYGLGIGCAAEVWAIHLMSRHGDFLRAGEAWAFTSLAAAAGLAYWLAAHCFTRAELPARQSVRVFWAAAVILRLAMWPVLPGDDLWRYRWEGMVQLHGFNPYQLAPDAPALESLRNDDWLKINHRNYAAIYPPLTQAIFAAMAALRSPEWSYKLLFTLADLAGIAVLRRLLARGGESPGQAAWYAWNPLTVYAFAGAAHFDSLMILPLLGAVWALDGCRRDDAAARETDGCPRGIPALCWVSALLLGLAIAVKIAPLALLPVWALAVGSWRRALAVLPIAVLPLAASALAYGFPDAPVFANLQNFGRTFRVNDPLWWLVEATVWTNPTQDNGLYQWLTLLICGALALWFRRDWRRGLLWVWGAALVLSPVVHAWYVVWVLPLAAWRGEGARAWFVFSISIFGYFLFWEVNHESHKPWEEPLWMRLGILLPPLAAWVWTAAARPRKTLRANQKD